MHRHFHLPRTAAAPRLARSQVRAAMEAWSLPGPWDDLLLVVSELVTNAFRHGSDPISADLVVEDDSALVAVTDADRDSTPEPSSPNQDEPTGRGLQLISAASSQWGWERRRDDKVVWAKVPLTE